MSHKTIMKIAIGMLVVYGATVLLYPMLFNPDSHARTAEAPPVKAPIEAPIEARK